jgi:hypothetical protein
MKLIIYTHTEFLDIYKIQQDHINILQNKNKIDDVIIFTNKPDPYYKYKQYYYDDTTPYANRVLTCIQQVDDLDEYFILCHDNDILISYEPDILDNLKNTMIQHNIDRLNFYCQDNEYNYDIAWIYYYKRLNNTVVKMNQMRSKIVDVSTIAAKHGGGGHPYAAGWTEKEGVDNNLIIEL